jgi:hypothetical protein
MDATNPSAVTEEELARARELVEHEPNYSPFNHDLYRLDLDKVYSLMALYARQEREAEREKLAQWMIRNSFATGHGDDIESLLVELKWQIAERGVQEREAERERIATMIRSDAFVDCDEECSHCKGAMELADRIERGEP